MKLSNIYSIVNLKSLSFTSFDANSILALRRGKDIVRRYYYFFTVAAQRGQGQGTAWSGWNNYPIRGFCGSPESTYGSAALRKTERAFPFEFNPANPSESSPWHNMLYEFFYNSFLFGMRAISIHFPFGHPDLYDNLSKGSWALTPLEWLNGSHITSAYTSTTNAEICPARVKGFTGAVRKIIEGNLKPVAASRTGETGINEPCDVLLYLPGFMGWGGYRDLTHTWWDGVAGNSAAKDVALTTQLDNYVAFIRSMKSNNPNHGILSVAIDVGTHGASPESVSLYRSMPDYRSDVCELADYYVEQKLLAMGIPVARESRVVVSRRKAKAGFYTKSTISGTLGATANTGHKNFSGDENYLWYSDPEINSGFNGNNAYTEVYVKNGVGDWTHRLAGSYTTFHGYLPYGLTYIVSYAGRTADVGDITNNYSVNGAYTPHHHLSHVYACADIYTDYLYRNTGNTGWANRRLLKNFSIFSIEPYNQLGAGLFYQGTNASKYTWWYNTIPTLNTALYPLFRTASPQGWTFTWNPPTTTGYSGGFWTATSRDWFIANIIGPTGATFGHSLNVFKTLAMDYNPPGKSNPPGFEASPGFTQWGSDPYYLNVIDPIIRQ